jgi:hypothetical protein
LETAVRVERSGVKVVSFKPSPETEYVAASINFAPIVVIIFPSLLPPSHFPTLLIEPLVE